jgi:limonene-1,2-epoxide hydrolase
MGIIRIENGKIVEMREEFDVLGLYQQLGMELKPKEGEK